MKEQLHKHNNIKKGTPVLGAPFYLKGSYATEFLTVFLESLLLFVQLLKSQIQLLVSNSH